MELTPGHFISYHGATRAKGMLMDTGRRVAVLVEVTGGTARAVTNEPKPALVRIPLERIHRQERRAKVREVNRLLKEGEEFGFSTAPKHTRRALWAVRKTIQAARHG